MLGNSDDLQKKTENEKHSETCYGGFGNRFSYERCVKNGGSRRITVTRIMFFSGIVLLLVSFGLLCGNVLFRLVLSNSTLYFPNGLHESSEKAVREASNDARDDSVCYVNGSSTLTSVTHEESQRYRIPTGVMIKSVEFGSDGIFGLESGDIIVAVNDREVLDIESLNEAISDSYGGEITRLTVFRDNDYVIVTTGMDLCNYGARSE